MGMPEYHFTSAQLADYLDKVRPVMVMAERERCARTAENMGRSNGRVRKSHKLIAEQIRAGNTRINIENRDDALTKAVEPRPAKLTPQSEQRGES